MTNPTQLVDSFVPNSDGRWVSENFVRLNEVVHDYDPNLDVGFLPSELQTTPFLREYCFLVFDRARNTPVFYFKPDETPAKVLARIFRIDTRKNDVLANLEAEETAEEILRLKALMDDQEDRKELADWIMTKSGNYPKFKPPGEDKVQKFDDKLHRI